MTLANVGLNTLGLDPIDGDDLRMVEQLPIDYGAPPILLGRPRQGVPRS